MNDDDDLTVVSWTPDDDPTVVMEEPAASVPGAPARPHDDVTVVMERDPVAGDEADRPMWQPGPRLDGRTPAPPTVPPAARGGGPLLAAAIIVAAIAIAVTLWLLAIWLRDDPVTATLLPL